MIPKLETQAIERDYAAAKETYAAFGVDTDAALQRIEPDSPLAALLAGRRRRRFRKPRWRAFGRARSHGQLPWERHERPTSCGWTSRRSFSLIQASTGSRSTQSTGLSEPVERNALRRSTSSAGSIGLFRRHRPRFQRHLLLAPAGGRWLHARPSGSGDPPLLGGARYRIPAHRR